MSTLVAAHCDHVSHSHMAAIRVDAVSDQVLGYSLDTLDLGRLES
jgi:hypothetical protein